MVLRFSPHDASAATGFGGNVLDRRSERRDEPAFVTETLSHPGGRVLLFADDRLVSRGRDALFSREDAAALGAEWESAVFLGFDEAGPLFAAAVTEPGEAFALHNLRTLAIEGWMAAPLLGAVAQGRSVLAWHATHRFCANCGTPTVPAAFGMRRDCPSCAAHHFPRTDPVVIMLAIDGERCLLGRQVRFPPGVYSALAGFMEPGETIENAVRREIWEEAGIETRRVAYHASQPWPFPASLMIGCFAEAVSFDVEPRDRELEDVRWFPRADIGPMLARTHPTYAAPPAIAIAHHLLAAYAEDGAPVVEEERTAPAVA